MSVVADVLVGLVAALHLYFLVLEMFLWTTPTGRKVFGLDPAFAEESKALAANQGLYNGFLAAGLVWGLVADRTDVKVFFLACVDRRRGRTARRRSAAGSWSSRRYRPLVAFVLVLRQQLTSSSARASRGTPRGCGSTRRASGATPTPCGSTRRSPSSRIVLNDSSASVSTAPSSRSSSSGVEHRERQPGVEVDVAEPVDGERDGVQPQVPLEQPPVDPLVVLVGPAADERVHAERVRRRRRAAPAVCSFFSPGQRER